MDEGQRSGSTRYATSIAILVVTLAVVGCGALTMLPRSLDASAIGFKTAKELAAAYSRVQPGLTPASQLARIGFDATAPNVEVLSYFGVLERFMPRDSTKFDKLNAALQSCIIEARDRCRALVFTPGDQPRSHGGGVFAALGFSSAKAASETPQVTLLVQNGRVAYKMISGIPLPAVVRRAALPMRPSQAAAVLPVAYRTVY